METYKLYNDTVTLQFDEKKHQYFVNGERAYGVTSATGTIDKSGPITYWAVNKMCIPFLKENIKPGKMYDEVELTNIFSNASTQHTRKKEDAANLGTLAHAWVEAHIKALLNNTSQPEMPINQTLQNLVNAFLKWERIHHVTYHESEKKIYSKKHGYAGTMDIEATVDDELCVVDLKTSNHIVDEYRFQVSAYMGARIEELKKKYKAYWIIRVGKEKKVDQNGIEEVEFEAIRYEVKTEFKKDFKTFLASLTIYKRLQELKTWNNQPSK
jgi:hypothetical protein